MRMTGEHRRCRSPPPFVLEESKEVIPMMEAMITQIEEQQNIMAEMQREKLSGRYKAKTVMYEALMFLLIWYSASTTLFQMIRSKVFISDCGRFFDIIATFIQTIAGCIVLTGKNVAQISDEISNPVIAGIIYWLIRILICGGCLVGAGILVAFIGIKFAYRILLSFEHCKYNA